MDSIINSIPVGKENAVHLLELAHKLGISTVSVKKAVRKARSEGIPVLSGMQGYWLADNDDDKTEFVLLMRSQAISRLKSARAVYLHTPNWDKINKELKD